MEFSKEELEIRRKSIGASEFGGLIGVSAHPNKVELYNWHVNGVRYGKSNVFTEVGSFMEPWVADRFVRRYSPPKNPIKLVNPRDVWEYGILRHPDYPWISATLDRFIEGTYEPVELKYINNPDTIRSYGEEGSTRIPPGYHVQLVVQLAVIRANCAVWGVEPPIRAYHFAYLGGEENAFTITWAQAEPYWRDILQHGIAYREDHWVPQIPPPPDSTEAYSNLLLAKRQQEEILPVVIEDSSQEVESIYKNMLAASHLEKLAGAAAKMFKNQLGERIGQNKGIKCSLGSLQWVGGGDKEETDWEAVACSLSRLVSPEDYEDAVAQHTRYYPKNPHLHPYKKKSVVVDSDSTQRVFALLGGVTPEEESSE